MSKFADKLQRVYKGAAPVLGFRRADEETLPQILVVANLVGAGVKAVKAAGGADAVIVAGKSMDGESFEQLSAAVGDIPLGVSLEGVMREDISRIVDSGFDFVVFDVKTPLGMVKKEGIGRVLQIEPYLDAGLIRAINELPLSIDGVLMTGEDSSVTVERLLICQRFSLLLDKPLLATIGPSVNVDELSGLCQAGVKAVVLSEGLTAKAITELRKAVTCLPKQAKRKDRSIPILPRIRPEPGAVETEEEEEEEDI